MSERRQQNRRGLKRRLLALVHAGTGTLVIASSVLAPLPADASKRATDVDLLERAAAARQRLTASLEPSSDPQIGDSRLARWGNWRNWGRRRGWNPGWHNWPNWRNWGNWRNW